MRKVVIVGAPPVQILDVSGPLEVFSRAPGYEVQLGAFTVTNPLELTFLAGESVSCHGKLYDLRERLARSTILGLESEPMKNGGVVRGQGGDR